MWGKEREQQTLMTAKRRKRLGNWKGLWLIFARSENKIHWLTLPCFGASANTRWEFAIRDLLWCISIMQGLAKLFTTRVGQVWDLLKLCRSLENYPQSKTPHNLLQVSCTFGCKALKLFRLNKRITAFK